MYQYSVSECNLIKILRKLLYLYEEKQLLNNLKVKLFESIM